MVQIAMVVFAFPIGAAMRSRRAALVLIVALFVIVSILQFLTTPQRGEVSYWVVQLITAVVAYGLVTWGATWGVRRRTRRDATA